MFLSSSCEIPRSRDTGVDFGASGEPRERFRAGAERLERSGSTAELCGKKSLIKDKQLFESVKPQKKGTKGDHC